MSITRGPVLTVNGMTPLDVDVSIVEFGFTHESVGGNKFSDAQNKQLFGYTVEFD